MSTAAQFRIASLLRTPTALTQLTDFGVGFPVLRYDGLKATNSGALTANTWTTLVTVSGGGVIDMAAVVANDTTSRNLGVRVTLDGTVINTATTTSTVATDRGCAAVGYVLQVGATPVLSPQPLPFTTSCVIEVRSSLSETDKVKLIYSLRAA